MCYELHAMPTYDDATNYSASAKCKQKNKTSNHTRKKQQQRQIARDSSSSTTIQLQNDAMVTVPSKLYNATEARPPANKHSTEQKQKKNENK